MNPQDDVAARMPVDPRALGLTLVNSTGIALAAIRAGRIVFANPAFMATFQPCASLNGMRLADLMLASDADRLADALAAAESRPMRHCGTARRGDGLTFSVELSVESVMSNGEPTQVVLAWDTTERQHSSEQLAHLAYTDTLTGLSNRAMFADRLHQSLVRARRRGGVFAVLMADLDGFKAVNDTLGHDVGDIVLQVVGQRFHGCVRTDDTLARIGGDEFAVLLPRLAGREAATLVAQRMITALAAPIEVGAHAISVGVSIGIAAWPDNAGSADALLVSADMAMYRAKRGGKNRIEWATGQLGEACSRLHRMAWSSAHAVGITEMDEQHRHLAQLIDRLAVGLRNGIDQELMLAGLDELISYTAMHFATEERLMASYDTAGSVRHREEHRRLLHEIRNLQLDGGLPSISLVQRYLQDWLLRHVDTLDKELGEALIAQGCR